MKRVLFVSQNEQKKALAEDTIKTLEAHGFSCVKKSSAQLRNSDYDEFDFLVGMEQLDLWDMYLICGGDFAEKMYWIEEFTDHQRISG